MSWTFFCNFEGGLLAIPCGWDDKASIFTTATWRTRLFGHMTDGHLSIMLRERQDTLKSSSDSLGSRTIKSLDFSDFEGAEIIHDLNVPIPDELIDRFDCIFDGGTIEHVFDIRTAISNVKRMLKIGGIFLMVDGANNFLGHGLYQFSPELLWRTFSRENGYEIELMQLVDDVGKPSPRDVPDPAVRGQRSNMTMSAARTYVLMAARKTCEIPDEEQRIYQSDYVAAWKVPGKH